LPAQWHGYLQLVLRRAAANVKWRSWALAAVQMYMMHGASGNGWTFAEGNSLFPRRFDRALLLDDLRDAPWLLQVGHSGKADFSGPLPVGAAAGLSLIRNSLILETTTPPSPLPDGGLFLLPAAPAEFMSAGAGVLLTAMPTAFGPIDFNATAVSDRAVSLRFRLDNSNDKAAQQEAVQQLERVMVRVVLASQKPLVLPRRPGLRLFDEYTIEVDMGLVGDSFAFWVGVG
jgi:hypothetical protein